LGLATLLGRKLWSEEEREAGIAGITMGLMGITEGAIPFAAADPLRVIPCIMAGSMVGAAIAMFAAVGDSAPHGGLIVLFVVSHRVAYVLAILIGTLVTAVSINVLKFRSRTEIAGKQQIAGKQGIVANQGRAQ
jgi:fructose-specific phosphotransferase system IIC component